MSGYGVVITETETIQAIIMNNGIREQKGFWLLYVEVL